MSMAQQILARASGVATAEPGDILLSRIDLMTSSDGTTFLDTFESEGLKVWDPTRLIFCFDHIFQPEWMSVAAATEHPKIKRFARAQQIPAENIYDLGRNGLSHQIPVEHGWALPGTVCLGLDTQSATMGAANCFAMPTLYGTEAVLLTGDVWIQVPESAQVRLHGALSPGVSGKDVAFRLVQEVGERVDGHVIEYGGPGLASLSVDIRMAIANGAVQLGALSEIFPADDVLLDYLAGRARRPFEPASAGPNAPYEWTFDLDLGEVTPLVAGPHDVDLLRSVDDVLGLPIQVANIGSCSSGRLSDLAIAAQLLEGRSVHPSVRLFVTPISASTARSAAESGILATLLSAGATITQPGCGGCYHGNLSPLKLSDGERCISTSVEANRGRMGSSDAEVMLANAAVVAASSIDGQIADPRRYLRGDGGHR
ncbi:aconitase family protein [Amycolatopsis sp. GM8]|uniref:3-isopropylmalate dehydratase large subunit n=1 Tax=Amycolatopsis sp. GM8 TaxID=2896530 RepID=UPI001F39A1EF|nr:aconitase family protein [Amycolatopsis sp. GM8]